MGKFMEAQHANKNNNFTTLYTLNNREITLDTSLFCPTKIFLVNKSGVTSKVSIHHLNDNIELFILCRKGSTLIVDKIPPKTKVIGEGECFLQNDTNPIQKSVNNDAIIEEIRNAVNHHTREIFNTSSPIPKIDAKYERIINDILFSYQNEQNTLLSGENESCLIEEVFDIS